MLVSELAIEGVCVRIVGIAVLLLLLAGCAHKAPLPSPILRDTPPPVVPAPPPHPAPRPPAVAEPPPVPLPAARPEMPGDHTPDHICADLAQRRAEDAATLGGDARKQQAVHDDVYARCISGGDKPAP
jgi:hypothetical protein